MRNNLRATASAATVAAGVCQASEMLQAAGWADTLQKRLIAGCSCVATEQSVVPKQRMSTSDVDASWHQCGSATRVDSTVGRCKSAAASAEKRQ